MFCNQCQEALNNYACEKTGVCGKDAITSDLMDVLIGVCKGLSYLVSHSLKDEINTESTDEFILDALFTTITNVNFDDEVILDKIKNGINLTQQIRDELKIGKYQSLPLECELEYYNDKNKLVAKFNNIKSRSIEPDIKTLKDIILLGLKGMAAYVHHAYMLGKRDKELLNFTYRALSQLISEDNADKLFDLVLKTGEAGVKAMKLLDEGHNDHFGIPEITNVYTGTKKGPAILVSGHDLLDLYELLLQTDGKGINIYTHGEMLPAHSYPVLKNFKHLIGNYGTAWHNQRPEFKSFNGAILFTSNCLMKPDSSYKDKMFTTGSAGYPGCIHISNRKNGCQKDFSLVIERALKLPGPDEIEGRYLTIGFGHNTMFSLAEKVVSVIKAGKIKKFVVMAGCDGRHKEREYYTNFAKNLPKDMVILTAGCAKYRYNMLDLGEIDGIPRVIDAGQCNDSYSLALIAIKLKEIFGIDDINKLPIAYNIAWYEQKAVIVLLALLYLGVKNIRIGPTLPAFVSKNILNILIEKFGIKTINTVENDMKEIV